MWRLRDALLNWVNTHIREISLLMQLLMGISTNLYLPAIGTAGLLREAVSGYNRVPAPPPKMTASVDFDRELINGVSCNF